MLPDPIPGSDAPGAHIWGWMGPDELHWLHDTAATMRSVVEVGVLRGRSAFALLSGCPGPVYCIDPWEDPGDHAWRGFMETCGHFENLVAVRGRSPAAAAEVPRHGILRMPDDKVDMVFIDAEHDYDSVMADIQAWLPKTLKLICGHDYSDPADYPPGVEAGYRGVHTAVHEVFGNRVELAPLTSIWTVRL